MASLLGKVRPDRQDFIPLPEHKGKHLYVRVWGGSRGERNDLTQPHLVAKPKKIPYGQPSVSMKIGGKERLYKINYQTDGMIKQEGKRLYYDTHFLNQVGGLRWYEFPEDLDAEEAYTVFKNNGVEMYVKKGGISTKILIMILAITAIAMVGVMVMASYTFPTMQQNTVNEKNNIALSNKIDQLRAQVQSLGGKPVV